MSSADYNVGTMRHVGATTLLSLGFLAAACAPPGGTAPGAAGAGETVALTVEPVKDWRDLRLEGSTDLPDGAVLSYSVIHALASELPPSEWPAKNLMSDGTAVVQDGRYRAELNATYWPAGAVRVRVQFPVAPQPAAIGTRYGEFGERLTGDNVTSLGGSQVVTVEQALDWTR